MKIIRVNEIFNKYFLFKEVFPNLQISRPKLSVINLRNTTFVDVHVIYYNLSREVKEISLVMHNHSYLLMDQKTIYGENNRFSVTCNVMSLNLY